ncbi:Glucosidase YgjK [Microbacterium sp. Bi98]|uniref:MGH1-like glycoside hydrolase domain-containing protein n=1 Tax=Microbacterium sp. Bi98 TaxID=2821116 RepID=UPI001D38124E|nr:trehalase family glycosidase [Microbacterium sp. Bi98]CAH0123785.1 Glucosidase YgjK [Microbacterium sp. Bi98]
MLDRWMSLLEGYIIKNSELMMREPAGILAHPYTVPSAPDAPYYSTALWDWDSWTISAVLAQVESVSDSPGRFFPYEEGSILNFLDQTDADGVIPICLNPEGPFSHGDGSRLNGFAQNMHKPVLAQHAAMLAQRQRNAEWLRPHMGKLGAFINRYMDSHIHAGTGLAYWQTDFAIGVDNDPSVFYRPDKSTASIYLNSLLYRELLAYGHLLEELDQLEEANIWRRKAQDLADSINTHCWDERDGTYYSVDLALNPIDESDWLHGGAPRAWSSLLLRIDNWSSFMPLWAGFVSQEQAERMVARLRDERTFSANFGVRTLSRLEKMYDLRATNNPSNWLGPIWGISNYLVFRGLVKYGYVDDARLLAEKTVALFGRDLETSGVLHEYYNPDNGEPIVTKGFQNWNFLVLTMIGYLQGRPLVTEF